MKYINIQSNVVTRRVKSEQNHTLLVARGLNPALEGESFKVDLVKSSFSVDKSLLMNTCAGEKQSPISRCQGQNNTSSLLAVLC